MPSPYAVPLSSLAPAPQQATTAHGPEEPTGAVPDPLPERPRAAEGPLDPALPVNGVVVSGAGL